MVLCGLVLIICVQPPLQANRDSHRGTWFTTLLALGLFVCLLDVLFIVPLRALFNLLTIWHFHLLECFLQMEWKDISNQAT